MDVAYILILRLGRAQAATGRYKALSPGCFALAGSGLSGLRARLAGRPETGSDRGKDPVGLSLSACAVADVQILSQAGRGGLGSLRRALAAWPGSKEIPGASPWARGGRQYRLFQFDRRPAASIHAARVLSSIPKIYRALGRNYEDHGAWERDPFETLASCILSLRTQDPVTDAASERLFAVMRRPEDIVGADPEIIAKLIYPVGMYRRKSRTLVEISRKIIEDFQGKVPSEIDELLTLPGVGRKTANLVRSFAFHLPALCVDTHVHRITNRWGLVRSASPDETELELRRILPRSRWMAINSFLVQHGQKICRPIRPRCTECFLAEWCAYRELVKERAVLREFPSHPPHPCLGSVLPFQEQ